MKNNHIFQKQNQSGRSMVEILGVIAIIGVLSIGGIIGYSYGMDKYRANQTIHDITLRGTDIIARSENLTPENYEELNTIWENENSPIYPTDFFYEEEYDRFGIQITGVPSDVCKIIGDNIADYIETRIEIEGEEHEIDDNVEECDLSDDNTMFFFFTDRKCLPECHSNEECIDGKCYGLQCESKADCNKGYDGNCSICSLGRCQIAMNTEGVKCTFDDGTIGQCNQGTCIEKPEEGCTYDTNVCTNGMYCASPNTSLDEAFPNGETGTCVEPRFNKYTITVNGKTEIWHISDNTMSYWDTVAACEANNWSLPSMADFTDTYSSGGGSFTRSTRAKNLNDAADGDWGYPTVWTTENGTDGDGKTVHYWIDLTTDYNNVSYAGRNQGTYYNAACKEPCVGTECQCTYDNNICTGGYYCASPNTSNTEAFPSGKTGACTKPQLDEIVIAVDGVSQTWYISSTPVSWWDAMAICSSAGLNAASANDLVVGWSNGNGIFTYTSSGTQLEQKNANVWISEHTDTSGYFVDFCDDYSNVIDRWTRSVSKFYALCKKP